MTIGVAFRVANLRVGPQEGTCMEEGGTKGFSFD